MMLKCVVLIKSDQIIVENQWTFLVVSFDGKTANLYLNGTLTSSLDASYDLPIKVRSECWIGRSHFYSVINETNIPDGFSYSYLDDLRFYNKSLTREEIIEIMSQS